MVPAASDDSRPEPSILCGGGSRLDAGRLSISSACLTACSVSRAETGPRRVPYARLSMCCGGGAKGSAGLKRLCAAQLRLKERLGRALSGRGCWLHIYMVRS